MGSMLFWKPCKSPFRASTEWVPYVTSDSVGKLQWHICQKERKKQAFTWELLGAEHYWDCLLEGRGRSVTTDLPWVIRLPNTCCRFWKQKTDLACFLESVENRVIAMGTCKSHEEMRQIEAVTVILSIGWWGPRIKRKWTFKGIFKKAPPKLVLVSGGKPTYAVSPSLWSGQSCSPLNADKGRDFAKLGTGVITLLGPPPSCDCIDLEGTIRPLFSRALTWAGRSAQGPLGFGCFFLKTQFHFFFFSMIFLLAAWMYKTLVFFSLKTSLVWTPVFFFAIFQVLGNLWYFFFVKLSI